MRQLIAYCIGGICNRLQPLADAMDMAEKYNRELLVYWEDAEYCKAKLNDLYKTKFNMITQEDMVEMGYPYCLAPTAVGLKPHHKTICGIADKDKGLYDTDKERVLYISNKFDPKYDGPAKLRTLELTDELQLTIDKLIVSMWIVEGMAGVHARGTDMEVSIDWYIEQIKEKITHNEQTLLITDCKHMKKELQEQFPNMITTPQQSFCTKTNDGTDDWVRNITIDTDACKSAIIDIYLLARTNIKVFWPASTFAKTAMALQYNKRIKQ